MSDIEVTSAPPVNEFKRGFWVLFASFVGIGVNVASMAYYATGIWTRPWQEEFGWTRTEIGGQQTIAVLMMVICAPFAGRLIDRFGLKRVTTLSLLGYGLLLLAFTRMSGSLWELYVLSAAYAGIGVASTGIAFTRAINAFFVRHRGLALGICLTSTGVAAYLIPKFLTPYVDLHGWRAGFSVMFVIVMLALPIVWFLIKEKPDAEEGVEQALSDGPSLGEALRGLLFWRLGAIFFILAVALLGLVPAFIPLLLDTGMTPQEAGSLGAIMGIALIAGRLLIGFLIDRVFAPYVTAVVFSLVGLGCLALAWGGISYAIIAAIALGFAVGAEVDLIGYFTARYFGLAHYGAIYGLQYSFFILGAGLAPIITGRIWDVTGNYDVALVLAAGLMVPVVALALSLPKFSR